MLETDFNHCWVWRYRTGQSWGYSLVGPLHTFCVGCLFVCLSSLVLLISFMMEGEHIERGGGGTFRIFIFLVLLIRPGCRAFRGGGHWEREHWGEEHWEGEHGE